MSKLPTTIRLDDQLRKKVLRSARKAGLNFSGVVHLLLCAFVEGTVQVGVTQYPKDYLDALGRETTSLRRLHREGKTRRYASSKAMFDDIHGR